MVKRQTLQITNVAQCPYLFNSDPPVTREVDWQKWGRCGFKFGPSPDPGANGGEDSNQYG
jgi:hypothetical protein